MQDERSFAPGTRIDSYVVGERLGHGAFAQVYRAFDTAHGHDVALKVLNANASRDSALARRFLAEAALLTRLHHPNIVRLYRAGSAAERLFLALELIEGVTLAKLMPPGRPLPPAQIAGLLPGLCTAIDYVHAAGAIHRDIKPANVMLTNSGRVVLMDFGIARQVDRTTMTQRGMLLGSPATIAPEQVAGRTVGPAADLYALAALCYNMLTGAPVFSGPLEAVLHAHAELQPVPLRARCPGLPDAVYEVVDAGLAKDPSRRPVLAAAFAGAFAGLRMPLDDTEPALRFEPNGATLTQATVVGFALPSRPEAATKPAVDGIPPTVQQLGHEEAVTMPSPSTHAFAPAIQESVSSRPATRRLGRLARPLIGILCVLTVVAGTGLYYRHLHGNNGTSAADAVTTGAPIPPRSADDTGLKPDTEVAAVRPEPSAATAIPEQAPPTLANRAVDQPPEGTPQPAPAAAARAPITEPGALYQALLMRPVDNSGFPAGLRATGAGPSDPGDFRRANDVIGTVEVAFSGADLQDSLYYNVYSTAAGAQKYFDNVVGAPGVQTNRRYSPSGFDVPITCLEQTVKTVDGVSVGETVCEVVSGPVEILAASVRDDTDRAGDNAVAEGLARSGLLYVMRLMGVAVAKR